MEGEGKGEEQKGFLDPGPDGERVVVNQDGVAILVKKSVHGVTRSPLLSVGESDFTGKPELR